MGAGAMSDWREEWHDITRINSAFEEQVTASGKRRHRRIGVGWPRPGVREGDIGYTYPWLDGPAPQEPQP